MKHVLAALVCLGLSTHAFGAVTEAVALSEPAGEGQQVNAVLLRYSKGVREGSLSVQDFSVKGREISGVKVVKPCAGRTMPYCAAAQSPLVLLRLVPDASGVVTDHVGHDPSFEKKIELEITRKGDGTPVRTERVRHLVAEDFTQHVYRDEARGISVPYNLYVPKGYRPDVAYPLVMFIHDAGATNANVKNTLYQGNGATVWATPEAQAREAAFVLAPQFDHVIVNDNSDDPADLDTTIDLIRSLSSKYRIDTDRIYTTGQSGGAMMSIAMNIRYPDFFAASYIVAGQWAAEKTAPMAHNQLFVLVSENDPKAFPGEKAIVEVLKQHGGVVHESFGWNASAPLAELDRHAEALIRQGGNIHFAAFQGGTLPMEKSNPGHKGAAHLGTWQVAYDIESIRSWLLSQRNRRGAGRAAGDTAAGKVKALDPGSAQ